MDVDNAAGPGSDGNNGGGGNPFEGEEDLDAVGDAEALAASNGYGGGEAGPKIGENHQAMIPDLVCVSAKDGGFVV